jgi:hypothetical protein
MPDPAIGARFYDPDAAEEEFLSRLQEIRSARGRA